MGKFPPLNECNPGVDPVEYNVVILPEPVEEVRRSGLILPSQTTEADKYAQVRGLLVRASPLAFNYDTWPADAAYAPPAAGDQVFYAKYAVHVPVKGHDGREYWMIKDKDVAAIVRPAAELSAA